MRCRKSVLILFITVIMAVLATLFALIGLSACAAKNEPEPYYGTYYCGCANGDEPGKVVIGKTYKDHGGEYKYTYSNGVLKVGNAEVVLAENYEVHYIKSGKMWSYGTTNWYSHITQRNGYIDETLYNLSPTGAILGTCIFESDGSYEITTYSDNSLPTIERGTYTLNCGVLTLNQTSLVTGTVTDTRGSHRYWYIDEELNIFGGVYLKHPEKFTFMPDTPDEPENPVTPDKPITPDTPYEPTKKNYTLTYTAGNGGRIIGTLMQTVESGSEGASVIAVADEGYEFAGWSDGVETAERKDTNVKKDIIVTALFEIRNMDFASGSGTKARPYSIENVEQLKKIQKYPRSHFILNNDIVLDDTTGQANFAPLFTDDNMFNGTFDGNGHKIVNLKLYNKATFYTGLFACIGQNGSIKNLTIENADISGTNYIGAVAGYSLGEITGCAVSGGITYLAENSYKVFIGGIVGRMENKLDKCATDVKISCPDLIGELSNIGGIAGYLFGDNVVEMSQSSATGDIVCENAESVIYVGGLLGYCGSGNDSNIIISNSYTAGEITATEGDVYAGGFVGYSCSSIKISNSYTVGAVTVMSSDAQVGGFIGYACYSVIISTSYTTGTITASASVTSPYSYNANAGGFVAYGVSAITISNCFAIGAITASAISQYSYDAYAGGFVGFCGYATINNSYTKGAITATASGRAAHAGGLVGGGRNLNAISSYTVCEISATSKSKIYSGALVGSVSSFKLNNAHWLYYADSGVEYAVGYGYSIGIPSSLGATKHTDISAFYTLAEVLNNGLDEPVWENSDRTSLPTLIKKED